MLCSRCSTITSKKECDFSIDNFGLTLCKRCQEDYSKLKDAFAQQKSISTPEAIKLHYLKYNCFKIKTLLPSTI